MPIQSFAVKAALAVAVALPLTGGVVLAQADQTPPQISNAKYQVTGIVNTDNVFVRSGPGDSFYATMKVNKGDRLTVVGQKFGWLKIAPPEGSFSYVAKAHVERTGDGTVGHVAKPELMVKAGSSETTMKYATQTMLNKGDEVQIIGQEDEYFKIKPPKGAYLYISKQYVDPAQAVSASSPKTPTADEAPTVTRTPNASSQTPSHAQANESSPTSSSKPSGPSAAEQFDKINAKFLAASKQPLTEQPIDELLKEFEALGQSAGLTDSMKVAVDSRVATLKLRAEALKELQQAKANWQANQKKQQASAAERQEIQQRLEKNTVKYFTAVGELRTSSLHDSGQSLYRLTDPNTGHTVVYIRDKDQKLVSDLGKFLGVNGTVATGRAGIRILTPTHYEQVNADEVGRDVAAQMMPNSLTAQVSAATQPASSDEGK